MEAAVKEPLLESVRLLPEVKSPKFRKRDKLRMVWDSVVDTVVKIVTFGCVPGLRHPWRAVQAQTAEQKKYVDTQMARIAASTQVTSPRSSIKVQQKVLQEEKGLNRAKSSNRKRTGWGTVASHSPQRRLSNPQPLAIFQPSIPEHLPEGKVKKAIEDLIHLLITAIEKEYLEKFRSIGIALIGQEEMGALEGMIEGFRNESTALLTSVVNQVYPHALEMFREFFGIHVYQDFIRYFHVSMLKKIKAKGSVDEERIRMDVGQKLIGRNLSVEQVEKLKEADRYAYNCYRISVSNPEYLREFFFHSYLGDQARIEERSIDTFSGLIQSEHNQLEALFWSILDGALRKNGKIIEFPREGIDLNERNEKCRKAFFLFFLRGLDVLPRIKEGILAKLLEWKGTKTAEAQAAVQSAKAEGRKIAPEGSASDGMAYLCGIAHGALVNIDFEERVANLLASTFNSISNGILSFVTDPIQFKSLYVFKVLPSLNQVMTRELMKKIMVNNLAAFIPHFTVMVRCRLIDDSEAALAAGQEPIDREILFKQEKKAIWNRIFELYKTTPRKTVKHLKADFEKLEQDDFGFYLYEPVINECFECIMENEAVHRVFFEHSHGNEGGVIQAALLAHFSKVDPVTADPVYGEFFSLMLKELGFTGWGKDAALSWTKDLMGQILARMVRDFSKGDFIIKMILDNANANFLGSRSEEERVDAIKQMLFGVNSQTRSLEEAFEEESKKLAVQMHDLIFLGNQLGGWGEWYALGMGKKTIVRSYTDLQRPIKNFPDMIMADKLLNQQLVLKIVEIVLVTFAAGACKATGVAPDEFIGGLATDQMREKVIAEHQNSFSKQ
jgi:hypothetical protein